MDLDPDQMHLISVGNSTRTVNTVGSGTSDKEKLEFWHYMNIPPAQFNNLTQTTQCVALKRALLT